MRFLWLAAAMVAGSSAAAQVGVPSLTLRHTLGCESCGGPDQFGSIWDVSISADGDLLVTDRDAPMLRRFNATGKSTWTGGRKGKGPGEYTLPIRAALTTQGVVVVDMSNSRVTELTTTGGVRTTIPVMTMPMGAAVNPRGDLWLGNDNFRGTLRLYHRAGDSLVASTSLEGSTANIAIAVAPDGSVAVMPSTKKYEIVRLDARGAKLPPILRDVPQVRRTPAEEAELRARMNRARGMVAAEAKQAGGSGSVPAFRPEELSLKDHLVIDGLRFDASGRLWVMTQRGDEAKSVIDVFSPSGGYIGAVTVPMRVTSYALGGSFLATAGENADGIPVVRIWSVK